MQSSKLTLMYRSLETIHLLINMQQTMDIVKLTDIIKTHIYAQYNRIIPPKTLKISRGFLKVFCKQKKGPFFKNFVKIGDKKVKLQVPLNFDDKIKK